MKALDLGIPAHTVSCEMDVSSQRTVRRKIPFRGTWQLSEGVRIRVRGGGRLD